MRVPLDVIMEWRLQEEELLATFTRKKLKEM